jgi:hypothetical protein
MSFICKAALTDGHGGFITDEIEIYKLNDLQMAFDDMLAGKNAKGVVVLTKNAHD